MSAGHDHRPSSRPELRTAFLLSFVILGVELAGGIVSHSLALLSDAGHVLTDVAALGFAWFAAVQARRPADASKTYGYHRTGILAAFLNALTLVAIVGFIAVEAVGRLRDPSIVDPTLMFVSAGIGIALNSYIGLRLHSSSRDDLNVRAAMLHVFGDVAASIGVIVAGTIVYATHWFAADAVVSLLIAILIAKGAWNLLRESVDILMEGTPTGIDVTELVRDVVRVRGVDNVHDLHVWSIAGGLHALSAHVALTEDGPLSACDALLEQINDMLATRYRIVHTTLQFECANCTSRPSGLYCSIPAVAAHAHAHAHEHEEATSTR